MEEGGGRGEEEECRGGLHNHLLPAQQWVADEFARAQRDGLLAVGHGAVEIRSAYVFSTGDALTVWDSTYK